ncbi:phytanoyl-CoA dioxygenase family protein [Thalassobius sp. I31.1]|uniref:phytanoyl-CoA dioxygenase family protein n=1 Tax=Thalassobius sp. I31.1 TaxID=2109912 RepID=UPI000D1A493A|nr:phytanoyl-CoA dioxygenase family protein [Thalassobius sp. I31.1]
MTDQDRAEFDRRGWLMLRGMVAPDDVARLCKAAKLAGKPGAREVLDGDLARAVQASGVIENLQQIWPGMQLVRLVFFDKSPAANWGVPWHQDRVISVAGRADVAGYTNWSRKGGTWHVEPPEDLLQQMLFVRLHLDDNLAENGAMQIVPGTHQQGKIPADAAEAVALQDKPQVMEARAGDVLVLKMLTLHGSSPAHIPTRRRVLRLDFAPFDLPEPLAWA